MKAGAGSLLGEINGYWKSYCKLALEQLPNELIRHCSSEGRKAAREGFQLRGFQGGGDTLLGLTGFGQAREGGGRSGWDYSVEGAGASGRESQQTRSRWCRFAGRD